MAVRVFAALVPSGASKSRHIVDVASMSRKPWRELDKSGPWRRFSFIAVLASCWRESVSVDAFASHNSIPFKSHVGHVPRLVSHFVSALDKVETKNENAAQAPKKLLIHWKCVYLEKKFRVVGGFTLTEVIQQQYSYPYLSLSFLEVKMR